MQAHVLVAKVIPGGSNEGFEDTPVVPASWLEHAALVRECTVKGRPALEPFGYSRPPLVNRLRRPVAVKDTERIASTCQ
jgi:hypothetical protein